MPGHELCGDYARALLAAQPSGTNLAQECAKARRHGFLDALSSGTARELCALLRRGVNQLEAWHAKYGEHQPQWLPPAGDVRWMEDVAAALDGRAALRAEVERLAAQAASAPAVRMLTEDEVAQATEDGERSFRRWTQGVRGQTLMPQDSPTFHYVMAGAAKALAAFRAAIIASLCGDVEPVAIYHGRCVIDCGEHGHLDMQLLKMIPAGTALCTASTVAALKAERDAALARVAELEKDAARYRWLRDGELTADYPYPVMRMGGSRVDDQTIWADELDAAIDDAISAAQHPQQEQSK